MNVNEILDRLAAMGSQKGIDGMERFGITHPKAFGVGVAPLRKLAREVGRDHALAQELWLTGYLDARILATLIDEPDKVTPAQMRRWFKDVDNWALSDACTQNLFDRTPHAWTIARDWTKRDEEFVKRAGFAVVAALAVHDKAETNAPFLAFLPVIEREAWDERQYVKKGVNWALRQIGKRNATLRRAAIASAKRVEKQETKAARWIARDALRELQRAAPRAPRQTPPRRA